MKNQAKLIGKTMFYGGVVMLEYIVFKILVRSACDIYLIQRKD